MVGMQAGCEAQPRNPGAYPCLHLCLTLTSSLIFRKYLISVCLSLFNYKTGHSSNTCFTELNGVA